MTRSRSRAANARLESGDNAGLVIIRAGTFFGGTRLADQHVAERLVDLGVPVLYVDPPVSRMSPRNDPRLAAVLKEPVLREVRPGLMRLTPRVPPAKSRGSIVHLTDFLVRRALKHSCADIGGNVRAVISVSARQPFGICNEGVRIFWARDDFVAGASLMNKPVGRVRRDEGRAADGADLIIAVSPSLFETWRSRGHRTVFVPNGCDVQGLANVDAAEVPEDVALPPPVLGFVGTLGDRVDFRLLRALAAQGRSLLLVGARQKSFSLLGISDLLDRPNVRWVGPKPYASLGSYLRTIDVGLVPYRDDVFNRASFPLKMLEYLAAGRPVVSSDLPAARWLDTALVRVARDQAEFPALVDEAVMEGTGPAWKSRRRVFAEGHSWSRRTEEILKAIEQTEIQSVTSREGA